MKKTMLIAFFALLIAAPLCMADTILLNDGQVLRGNIVSENADSVIIQTYRGNEETIGRNFIKGTARDENYNSYGRMTRRGIADGGQWNDDEWIFTFSVDFDGTHETSNGTLSVSGQPNKSINGSQHVDSGVTMGLQYVSYLDKHWGIGGGLDMQSLRSLSGGTGSFGFMPMYAIVKLRTTPGKNNTFEYLTGNLGYNFFSGDDNYAGSNGTLGGGLYWGVGAGINVRRIKIELLYTEDNGKAEDSGYQYDSATGRYDTYFSESGDIKYSKLGLNIGFSF